MLGKILLPIRTKRAVKTHASKQSPGYSDAAEIGILFRYQDDEHYEKVLQFVRKLTADKKVVSMMAFSPKKEFSSAYQIPHFSQSNLSMWGKLSSEEIELFLTRDLDFLINLDTESHEFVDSILSRSKAKCKIGHFMVEKKDFYQMMIHIDPSSDFEVFLEKIYYYIKNLRADA